MQLLPLRFYGDPILRQKAQPLAQQDLTDEFRSFVESLGHTMYENNGLGLAATQVGDLRRVFVADVAQVTGPRKAGRRSKDPSKRELLVFINPEILDSSPQDIDLPEGCLSIPDVDADVYRPIRIKVRYRTMDWELKEEWLDDLFSRVFQHELDHLDGILFIDRLGDAARTKLAGALNRLKKMTEDELRTHASN